ncbi:MAG: hypothetical protein GY866_43390 [Proteobacteria bacterium]|nr:hypothetical protein [Pseudomonadota bacterium]
MTPSPITHYHKDEEDFCYRDCRPAGIKEATDVILLMGWDMKPYRSTGWGQVFSMNFFFGFFENISFGMSFTSGFGLGI